MPSFRFIHTSDLHLGRRFGNMPEEIRGRLIEARHVALQTIAETARKNGAQHVLVAGDTFDTETPSDQTWRQALAAMAEDPNITWWIIPGNHDSLAAEALWERLKAAMPPNVRVLYSPSPVEISAGVTLLPAPASRRFPGRDLTDWMTSAATPERNLRIGLAHGGVQTFGSEDEGAEIIPPDRAARSGLDYLALGDWHGFMKVGDRTFYSGTPEADRFKHSGHGVCLAITLERQRALPNVEAVRTGKFDWLDCGLSVTPKEDVLEVLAQRLPPRGQSRRDVLVRLRASGWIHLDPRMILSRAVAEAAPEFGHFEYDESDLATEYQADDLEQIDAGGALRLAADMLLGEAQDASLAEEQRRVADAALNRLYSLVKGDVE